MFSARVSPGGGTASPGFNSFSWQSIKIPGDSHESTLTKTAMVSREQRCIS